MIIQMAIRSSCWRQHRLGRQLTSSQVGKQRRVFRKTGIRTYSAGQESKSRSMSVFTSWPPDVTTEQLDQLTLLATTYALSRSILYLPPISPEKPPPPAPESAVLAPISLIPTPIPRHLFSKALSLQHAYNTLYARIALDTSFLDQVMGPGGVADVDDFTSALWSTWKKLRDEGVPPVRRALLNVVSVPLCADGIDFLLASPPRPLSL